MKGVRRRISYPIAKDRKDLNKKPSSGRKVAPLGDERSPRDFRSALTFLQRALPHPTPSGVPSRREPLTQTTSHSIFRLLLSSAIASFEPRDYGGVFIIQEKGAE